jgi:hypothetical protein
MIRHGSKDEEIQCQRLKFQSFSLVVIRGFQGWIGDQRVALTRRGGKDRQTRGIKGVVVAMVVVVVDVKDGEQRSRSAGNLLLVDF